MPSCTEAAHTIYSIDSSNVVISNTNFFIDDVWEVGAGSLHAPIYTSLPSKMCVCAFLCLPHLTETQSLDLLLPPHPHKKAGSMAFSLPLS